MIFRGPKPKKNYYVLDHRIARDERLSWEARGVLIYLLGKPDNWSASVTDLRNQVKDTRKPVGKTTIYNVFAELEAAGYMMRFQPRDGGKMCEAVNIIGESEAVVNEGYLAYQEASNEAGSAEEVTVSGTVTAVPHAATPPTVSPDAAKRTLRSNEVKDISKTKEIIEFKNSSSTVVSPAKLWEVAGKENSPALDNFIYVYQKRMGKNKRTVRMSWHKIRSSSKWGDWSYESRQNDVIKLLESQIRNCADFETPRFRPSIIDYLDQEMCFDPHVPKNKAEIETSNKHQDFAKEAAAIFRGEQS